MSGDAVFFVDRLAGRCRDKAAMDDSQAQRVRTTSPTARPMSDRKSGASRSRTTGQGASPWRSSVCCGDSPTLFCPGRCRNRLHIAREGCRHADRRHWDGSKVCVHNATIAACRWPAIRLHPRLRLPLSVGPTLEASRHIPQEGFPGFDKEAHPMVPMMARGAGLVFVTRMTGAG